MSGYTRLQATSIGPGAEEALHSFQATQDRDGTILQVFDRTVYLELGEDNIAVIGTASIRDGPLMVRTNAGSRVSFSDMFAAGDTCHIDGRDPLRLVIGTKAVLEIAEDLNTPENDSNERTFDVETGGPVWDHARRVLDEACSRDTKDGLQLLNTLEDTVRSQDQVKGQIGDIVEATVAAVLDGPAQADLSPLEWLLGRGPGATPSGDDVLAGIVYVLARSTTGTAHTHVQETVTELREHGPQTTTMSSALLGQAAQGRAADPIEACYRLLLDTESDPAQAVTTVDPVGHHSGNDILTGMLTALLLISPRI